MSSNIRILDRDYPTLQVPEGWKAVVCSHSGEGKITGEPSDVSDDQDSYKLERGGDSNALALAFNGLCTVRVVESSTDFSVELRLEESDI